MSGDRLVLLRVFLGNLKVKGELWQMANYTGYGSITLSFEKKSEGENEQEAFEKLVKALNNYKKNPNDLMSILKDLKVNDFDVEWEDIQED